MTDWLDVSFTAAEAAEYLCISSDEAMKLPIDWMLGPDGDIWYYNADVERLKARGWRPKRALKSRESDEE
jgi:hypothetical protein